MYSRTTKIINPTGLHARPASDFMRTAVKFKSRISIGPASSQARVNAKSIVMILSQALSCGTEVTVEAEGEDEVAAVDALIALIDSGCGE